MKPYLFTGGWGNLGKQLQPLLPNISPQKTELDICDPSEIVRCIKIYTPSAIIHMAAISNQTQANSDKTLSYRTNVIGTRYVAEAAASFSVKIFYISTDYVFPGTIGNYKEEDNPSPANWYGYTKLAGELEIQNSNTKYCIIRTSFRPIMWQYNTAYTNVYTSADYIDIIAQEIAFAIKLDLRGIIHVGTAKKNMYELARLRNPNVLPEIADPLIPSRRDLCISKWLIKRNTIKK